MLQPARKMPQEMVGHGIPQRNYTEVDMGSRAGRKVLWDALVWEKRPGNRKRFTSQDQFHFQSFNLCIDDAPG